MPEPVADDTGAQRHIDHIVSRSHEIGAAEREAERLERAALRARAERRPDPSVGLRWLDERGGEERSLGVVVSIPFGGARVRPLPMRNAPVPRPAAPWPRACGG
ncbi:MAG: hypothetical protein ACWGG5_00965 [Stenotrophomonas sp.]